MSIINSVISGLTRINDTVQRTPAAIKEKLNPAESYKSVPHSEPQEVHVDFSHASKEVIMLREQLEDISDIRYEKVHLLKAKMASNEYEISYEKTAENILNSHLRGIF